MQGSIFTSMSGDTAHVTSIYVPWSACGDDLATTSPIGHAHHPNMPALGAQHAQSCSIALHRASSNAPRTGATRTPTLCCHDAANNSLDSRSPGPFCGPNLC